MNNWNLKELFTFTPIYCKILNDTEEIKEYTDKDSKKHDIKPNSLLSINHNSGIFEIQNTDSLRLSDGSTKFATYQENLNNIITKYSNITKNGELFQVKKFLDFHFKRTKKKKVFLEFIKYFIKPKLWMEQEAKQKYTANDTIIEDWIKSKEKKFSIRKNLWIVIPTLLFLIFGIIIFKEYRAMIIGAMIAIFSTQIIKLVDNITN